MEASKDKLPNSLVQTAGGSAVSIWRTAYREANTGVSIKVSVADSRDSVEDALQLALGLFKQAEVELGLSPTNDRGLSDPPF